MDDTSFQNLTALRLFASSRLIARLFCISTAIWRTVFPPQTPDCALFQLFLALLLVLAVSAERPCRYELAELVTNHILCNINRNMLSSVMNGDSQANHLWENGRTAGPGFNNLLIAGFIYSLDLDRKSTRLNSSHE